MEEKDEVLEYMANKEWQKESKIEGKNNLFRMAKESKKSEKLSNKIGGMLIYNQIIEQLLKEIIVCSIAYIKAEIWPTSVKLDVCVSKLTFGKLIEYFKKFVIKKYNREILIKYLEQLNNCRNEIVHKLFDFNEINQINLKLDEYGDLSDEVINLLLEYYNVISEELNDLDKRVNFESLI